MKKLMILGGSEYAVAVIEKAHQLGIYVVTCDYLPENIAHKYSDEYCNISVVEKDKVLKKAQELNIDGIISFACDPGVVTAAYVAEKMNLPFQCSYESACILQNKGAFRHFLEKNGFNTPKSKCYSKENKEQCIKEFSSVFELPVIVKPVDSAGSKGVSKVTTISELPNAIDEALYSSISKQFIVEKFLVFNGFHSSADLFTVDGKIKFISYSDHLFDTNSINAYVPSQIIWHTTMKQDKQDFLTCEIQRVFDLLGMKNGIYNVETCVDINDVPYIMEISPRGGGCRIAELQNIIYGDDLIENEIRSALGLELLELKNQIIEDGCWCEFVVHSNKSGFLKGISFDKNILSDNIKAIYLNVRQGDYIEQFTGANKSLGNIFIRSDTREEMDKLIATSNDWINIEL